MRLGLGIGFWFTAAVVLAYSLCKIAARADERLLLDRRLSAQDGQAATALHRDGASLRPWRAER